jgi:hypothetical protein
LVIEGLAVRGVIRNSPGRLLVNELAPRPHNSYHQSERGCVTSQFEQLVRTTCNLPLGDTSLITPAAIVNLLGEVWLSESGEPNFAAALAVPGVRLHLYEKHTPRVGAGRWGTYPRLAQRRKRRWSGCWKRSGGSRSGGLLQSTRSSSTNRPPLQSDQAGLSPHRAWEACHPLSGGARRRLYQPNPASGYASKQTFD